MTGAIGVGFKTNVRELYEFLAKHYEQGDDVYLFGFSRGAATIRAFTGFIDAVGLLNGKDMPPRELAQKVETKFKEYKEGQPGGHKDAIPIKFVGVWDTVSALGGPSERMLLGRCRFLSTSF